MSNATAGTPLAAASRPTRPNGSGQRLGTASTDACASAVSPSRGIQPPGKLGVDPFAAAPSRCHSARCGPSPPMTRRIGTSEIRGRVTRRRGRGCRRLSASSSARGTGSCRSDCRAVRPPAAATETAARREAIRGRTVPRVLFRHVIAGDDDARIARQQLSVAIAPIDIRSRTPTV